MRRLLVVALLSLVACAGPAPAGSPGPQQPVLASDTEGPFRLTFGLPASTWRAGEAIEGEARLEVAPGMDVRLSGSGGGVLAFEFRELTGERRMQPVWTADCGAHRLTAGQPKVSGITKSGGWSDDEPHADFYKAFFADPAVRLPAGDWEITALAVFSEGEGCAGASRELRASVTVHVTD